MRCIKTMAQLSTKCIALKSWSTWARNALYLNRGSRCIKAVSHMSTKCGALKPWLTWARMHCIKTVSHLSTKCAALKPWLNALQLNRGSSEHEMRCIIAVAHMSTKCAPLKPFLTWASMKAVPNACGRTSCKKWNVCEFANGNYTSKTNYCMHKTKMKNQKTTIRVTKDATSAFSDSYLHVRSWANQFLHYTISSSITLTKFILHCNGSYHFIKIPNGVYLCIIVVITGGVSVFQVLHTSSKM